MTSSSKTLSISVCRGPSCSLMGSAALADWCRDLQDAGIEINFEITSCTGHCKEAPIVAWNGKFLTEMSTAKMTEQLIAAENLLVKD